MVLLRFWRKQAELCRKWWNKNVCELVNYDISADTSSKFEKLRKKLLDDVAVRAARSAARRAWPAAARRPVRRPFRQGRRRCRRLRRAAAAASAVAAASAAAPAGRRASRTGSRRQRPVRSRATYTAVRHSTADRTVRETRRPRTDRRRRASAAWPAPTRRAWDRRRAPPSSPNCRRASPSGESSAHSGLAAKPPSGNLVFFVCSFFLVIIIVLFHPNADPCSTEWRRWTDWHLYSLLHGTVAQLFSGPGLRMRSWHDSSKLWKSLSQTLDLVHWTSKLTSHLPYPQLVTR